MYKVLIVDDEPLILSGLQSLIDWEERLLEVAGTAQSAEDALVFMAHTHIDILITDIRMSGLSGIELIEEIRKTNQQIKMIVISSYEDFEYLKSVFQYGVENYILKPIDEEELKETLANTVEKLEQEQANKYREKVQESILLDNVLHTWIQSTQEDAALDERLMLYGTRLNHTFYRVAVVMPKLLQWEADEARFDYHMLNEILRSDSPDISVCITVDYIGRILIVYGYDQEISEADILAYIFRGLQVWEARGIYQWYISLGKAVTFSHRLHESFISAIQLSLSFFISPCCQRISYDAKQQRVSASLQNTRFTQEALTGMISAEAADLQSVIAALHKELAAVLSRPLSNKQEIIEDILYSLFYSSEKIMRELQEDFTIAIHFEDICGDAHPREQADKICALFSDYVQQFPKGAVETHPMVVQILKIVEKEYSSGLSLKTLAVRLDVSQVHLGRLFKRDIGKMFTDYLNDFRIEKAKQLLLHTTLKSSEIAEKVGFSNPNYFSNTFKKMVGIYPTRYRNMQIRT